jgi:hypothetical protein
LSVLIHIQIFSHLKMSDAPITKADASNIQSHNDRTGQDSGKGSVSAAAQSFGDKNYQAADEATRRGFNTESNYNEKDTTKPGTTMKK